MSDGMQQNNDCCLHDIVVCYKYYYDIVLFNNDMSLNCYIIILHACMHACNVYQLGGTYLLPVVRLHNHSILIPSSNLLF